MICALANSLWLSGCLPEAVRFRRATARVSEEQTRLLRRLLAANAGTEFGRRHAFGSIRTPEEYQRNVPLATFDDYGPAIERLARGETNLLTAEPVRMFEPTSGSSGATKLVPYTASLQADFQRGIKPWIANLFRHYPDLMAGSAFWSISPAGASSRSTASGIPIGFDDDSQYVGGWQQRMVRSVMAVPTSLRHIPDIERFRYQTLLALIDRGDLRLISVWNPTFLSLLVERLPEWGDQLAQDLGAASRRAEVLRAAIRARTPGERHATLWPRLGLISCWSDRAAAVPADRLAAQFPQARIQGKGLIATEGFVSLPLVGRDGAALAVRSHFFEFAPVDAENRSAGQPLLAFQLDRGHRYAVILSTGGGLYRYQLQDVVQVVGHVNQCPLIRFVGRQGYVSDRFGEKLNEAHVARTLHEALDLYGLSPSFAMLACDDALPGPAYVLYIDVAAPDEPLARLAHHVDTELRHSFHYDYARRLGQLGSLRVFRAEGASEDYLREAARSGQRLGDIKTLSLDRRTDWSNILRGRFIPGTLELAL